MPNKADQRSIKSKFTSTMIESLHVKAQKPLATIFPKASPEALDLLSQLLQFNPNKRLTAEQSLQHPYLAQFHNPDDEPVLDAPISIPIDDNKRFSVAEYRKNLYRKIVQRKKELRKKQRAPSGSSGSMGPASRVSQSRGADSSSGHNPAASRDAPVNSQRSSASSVSGRSSVSRAGSRAAGPSRSSAVGASRSSAAGASRSSAGRPSSSAVVRGAGGAPAAAASRGAAGASHARNSSVGMRPERAATRTSGYGASRQPRAQSAAPTRAGSSGAGAAGSSAARSRLKK